MIAPKLFTDSSMDSLNGSSFSISYVDLDRLDRHFIDEWAELEATSIEANAFLSPSFVLPALKHLPSRNRVVFIAVRDQRDALVGLAVLEHSGATRIVPFPHLRAFRTLHSFRSGILVAAENRREIIAALLDYLAADGHWGIEFGEQWLDSPLVQELRLICDECKYHWWEAVSYNRPSFQRPTPIADGAAAHWSKSRRKSVRKAMRRLEDHGEWNVRTVTETAKFSTSVETFLRLEHAGWKAGVGSSLLSSSEQSGFFREMMHRFHHNNAAFFVELHVGETVIGSTANFCSGTSAFAFKVGWDPEFAFASPGMLLDALLLTHNNELLPKLSMVDSCAKGDSYLGNLWPEKIRIGNGVLALKRRSRLFASAVDQGRQAKRALTEAMS